jgi:UDP-N-acetylmuramyl tripeptide synthase
VVVNGDDPLLVTLTDGLSARRLLFGIEQTEHRLPALAHSAEVVPCGACGERLTYRQIFVGHLGDWMCESCGRGRPPLHVSANAVELVSPEFQSLKIATEGEVCHFEAHLPGLYNTYNVLAAASAALAVGVPTAQTQRSIAAYRGTFGRGQRLEYRGRMLTLMLVKNPVGGDETLRVIAGANRRSATPMMIVLNDGAADGRDVSWIWDVDFEQVAEWEIEVCCAGTRSADMRNRLYYAGVPAERLHDLGPGLGGALDIFVEPIPSGAAGFILSTYTGLMQLRAAVVRPGQSAASEAD